MATENIKRSKVLAEIRNDIKALPNFGTDSYNEAVSEIKKKVRENKTLISSVLPDFNSIWHDVREAIFLEEEKQILLFWTLADMLDKPISDEIKSEAQAFSNDISSRIKSFSSEVAELMHHISDIHPDDLSRFSPEISCTLSEISSQIDELLRLVDAI